MAAPPAIRITQGALIQVRRILNRTGFFIMSLFSSLARASRTCSPCAPALLLSICACHPACADARRGVEILWDTYCVPHVYAGDKEGLFFGYGYAQMHSHGNLILKLYGESRGRSAEYWGESHDDPKADATNLQNDRWVRLNGVPQRADAWLARQTPEFQRYFAAFADGMNAYARRFPETLSEERKRVLPIRPVDPLLHVHKIVHFGYLSPLRSVEAAVKSLHPASGPAPVNGEGGESNAWAIAPARSASGKTLLLMNPHLPWSDWSLYYEAHLNAPGVMLYGSSQVGFPMLRFVVSERLGFTQTVNSLDGSDLYRLKLTDDGTGYLMDGKVLSFQSHEETLRIRNTDGSYREEKLLVRSSIHGPVVWDKDGITLALRTVGLDRPYMIEQYWNMALAPSFAEYQRELRRLQVPTFNITYGDRDGHIMYLYNGTLPKRTTGDAAYWSGVIPGDTESTLWSEVYDYDSLPKVIDPASGWVQNTNNPPWTATLPILLDPGQYPLSIPAGPIHFRTQSSLRMLNADTPITFAELTASKHSTHLEMADRILDDLVAQAESAGSSLAKNAAATLKAWNRRTDNLSRGALLFEAFARRFMGPSLSHWKNFAVAPDWRQPLTTPRGLKDPAEAVRMLESAAEECITRYGALDAPWGQFRRFAIGATDLPGNGADGNLGAFRVMRYIAMENGSPRQKAVFGDTFTALVEFASPLRLRVLTSYGNSTQAGEHHSEDQLALLSRQELRDAWIERKDVEANLALREKF